MMNEILRVAATVLTFGGAAAIWHGEIDHAILMLVLAIACRQVAGKPA